MKLVDLPTDGASFICGRYVGYDPVRDSVTCDRPATKALPEDAFPAGRDRYVTRALCPTHAEEAEAL